MYSVSILTVRAVVIHMKRDLGSLIHAALVTGIMVGTVLVMVPDVMAMFRIIAAKTKVKTDID